MNKKLAIAIPTYNRSEIFLQNLRTMLPEIREAGVAVYISDDSSDDLTEQGVALLKKEYASIVYERNRPSLGHDRNCLKTLSMPETDYVWYLGDATFILPGKLEQVLGVLDGGGYDFVSVNSATRGKSVYPSKVITDYREVWIHLAWHLTMTGVSIYKRSHLANLSERYGKLIGTNFPQLGILLEESKNMKGGYYWTDEPFIDVNSGKAASYWQKRVFEIFAEDWVELFDIIGAKDSGFTPGELDAILKSHSKHTQALEPRILRDCRIERTYDYRVFKTYREFLKRASNTSLFRLSLISVTPGFILKIVRKLSRMLHPAR